MNHLNKIYLHQLFDPRFVGIFLNSFYFYRKRLHKRIATLAPNLHGKILDYGCGLKPYQHLFVNSTKYVGIDIENEGHDHQKEDIDLFYDGINLPFEDNSFEGIFCSEVFEHIEDLSVSLPEIVRVLKSDGILLITVPFVWMEHEMPNDYRRFTLQGISSFLSQNGFEIIESHKISHFVETLIQTWCTYIYSFYCDRNKYLRMLLTILFISPMNILGIITSIILPKKQNLYLGSIVLARKGSNELILK